MRAPLELALVALIAAAPPPARAEAPARDRVDQRVDASIADDLATLTLRTIARYTPAVALDEVPIVLAAERYRAPPPLTPSEVREAFPGDFSPGGFEGLELVVGGAPCTPRIEVLPAGERVAWCRAPIAAGEPIAIEARATLRIPERFGGFGRVQRSVTLAGAWLPQPARPGQPPPRGPWSLSLSAPAPLTAVLGTTYRPSAGEGGRRVVQASGEGAQIPLFLRPAAWRALSLAEGAARFLTSDAPHREDGGVLALQTQLAVEDALRLVPELGLPAPDRAQPLVLIEAPLRHVLTETAEGVVLVSDRAFRMVEVDRFLRFHALPMLRDVFGVLAARALGPEVGDRALTADVVGTWALERYVTARYGGAEDAFDVLGIVSFIPSIDQMLYAPDLAFAGAYFRNVPEDHALRPDLIDFPLGFPRGKWLYEKLRERLGPARASAIVARARLGGGIGAATRAEWPAGDSGGGAETFLQTWLGPPPKVRYRLAAHQDAPEGAGFRASATVERIGDPIAEPVTVRFTDDDGAARDVVASATTAAIRVVTATLAAPLDEVEIDPLRRLLETGDADAPDPRYLHRSSPEWKVLLNNFNVLLAATEGAVETALDLGIARRHDAHWGFGVRAEYAADAISLGLRASRAFGERVTSARLAHAFTASAEGAYLRPGFAGAEEGGAALLAGLGYSYDDRISVWAPQSGTAVRVGAGYQRIVGTLTSPELTADAVSVSVRGLRQWRLGLRHQLSVRGSVAAYVAGRPQAQLLLPLGGRQQVRGYATDAELARARGIVSAEWLHPLITDLDVNGFFLAWVTGIDGALFVDAALAGDTLAEAVEGPVFGDVGYGLRFYIDYFGVRPGVLAVEVALPLVRARGASELGPPAVYITFSPSFVAF